MVRSRSVYTVSWRNLVVWMLMVTIVINPLLAQTAFAQVPTFGRLSAPPPPQMPKKVSTRKGLSKPSIFRPKLNLSANPSDFELRNARIFLEPLIPMSGAKMVGENAALAKAILAFKAKKDPEDVSDLTRFVAAYSKSRWVPSLELNIGLRQFDTGYISEALSNWKAAWERAKSETGYEQKAIANTTAGNLTLMEARLGQKEDLRAHLEELSKRHLDGSAAANIQAAREGLGVMNNRPEIAYKCGPYALNNILMQKKGAPPNSLLLVDAHSTDKGTNLRQLKDWSDQVGLHYRAAKKTKGVALIVPSVMHLKTGHFAAIVIKWKGRYQVKDPTFGTASNMWLTQKAIDAETDGYCLVPGGNLPPGWQSISQSEASSVWGKGFSSTRNDNKPPSDPHQCPGTDCGCDGGMARASVFSMQSTLNIQDVPLSYSTPKGPPMQFGLNYNYSEQGQPTYPYPFTNFGPNWSFNWNSYLTVDSSNNVTVRVRGGGIEYYPFIFPDNVSNPYPPYITSQANLTIVSAGVYQRQLPDGTIELFNQPDGSTPPRIFMTEVIDPHGVASYISYNSHFRITQVVDSIGFLQNTNLAYASNTFGSAGYYNVVSITDPFSRTANFAYDLSVSGVIQNLITIADVIGLTSQFIYGVGEDGASSMITAMTTPYGTTSFTAYLPPGSPQPPATTASSRGLKFNFPDGTSSVVENWIGDYAQTFFWDREATALYPADPVNGVHSHCKTTQWQLGGSSLAANVSPVIDSVQPALEHPTLYTYAGQTTDGAGHHFISTTNPSNAPIQISRTITGTTTQTWNYQRNAFGQATQSIDPVGRTFTYKYAANNIDLLEKRQTQASNNDLNGKWQYNNNQHEPNVYIDGSGRKTQYAYNSAGQLTTLTDANSNVWTNTYDSSGYRIQLQGPLAGSNDITTFSYDGYGRLYQVTDSEGYTITYSYDNADRLTQTTYPDGTFEQMIYDRLDAVMYKDRIGRWTQRAYDSMDQLTYETDPLSRKTQYSWCACGSLMSLTDPAGNVTNWLHDLEGRVVQKVYPDNSTVNYAYDTVGRLQTKTDALNQSTNFTYNLDNTLSQKSYTNAANPTSTVNYTYDANYLRLSTVQNGWGTVTNSYNAYITDPFGTPTTGAGMLNTATNNVISNSGTSYTYDALGRTTNRSINGASNSTTWAYDAMSRVTSEANPLGTFNYRYVDDTSGSSKGTLRLSTINYPNSQTTNFYWYGNSGDQRLQSINNLSSSGAARSQFSYAYDPAGEIVGWAQQNAGYTPIQNSLSYDLAGQLIGAQGGSGNQSPMAGSQNYYSYDSATNRTAAQSNIAQTARIGGTVTTADTLTITVVDAALSGGQEAVTYTVQAGDTTTKIAAGLAAAITSDANLQTLGVNAVSSGPLITIKSTSSNQTTFTSSLSIGATETITLGVSKNAIQNAIIGGSKTTGDTVTITVYDPALSGGSKAVTYTVLSTDTLTSIATGVKSAINADSSLAALGVTATSASTVVSIKSTSTNLTTYAQSTSAGATESVSLAVNMNSSQTALVGGTKTTGDVLKLTVYDAGLSGGQNSTSYTVLSTDTLTTIASGLTTAINGNSALQAIGVTASSSGTLITLSSNSVNVTTYSASRNSAATETILVGINSNGTQTAAIGGSKTTGDVLTITVFDGGLSGGSTAVTYTVLSTDTLSSIATGMASAINGNSSLSGIGVTASATSTVVNISSTSANLTTYTQSVSGGGTETITLGRSSNITQSLYNNLNELVNITPGGLARFTATTNKPIKSAAINTQVISISAPSPSPTTYSSTSSANATETLSLGSDVNNIVTATVGGTITAGDVLTFVAENKFLPIGHSVSYTVLSTDTLTSIASAFNSAINADTTFQQAQITSTSSGTAFTVTANNPKYSLSVSGTETLTAGTNVNGNMTVTVGGTKTTGNTLTITVTAAGIAAGPEPVTYTVLSTDALPSIAAGLANAINSDANLLATGITAKVGTTYLNWAESFTGTGILPSGTSTANVSATDGANNTKTNPYQYSVKGPSSQALTYDLNGNMTSDGTNTYQWDAENRLIQINYPGTGNNSQFSYDGLDHCVKIIETSGGTITSTKQFVWAPNVMSEVRNSTGTLVSQYFKRGQKVGASSYYYDLDHIGSVWLLSDSSGNTQAQQGFDPYGRISNSVNTIPSDFTFAHYYLHAPSGFNLTWFREYVPSYGRWISRDKMGEAVGSNLYMYVMNKPVKLTDPLGLQFGFQHGNWTGRGYSSGGGYGENSDYMPMLPSDPGFEPPTDCIDTCAWQHDICMHIGHSIQDPHQRRCWNRDCHHQASGCFYACGGAMGDFLGALFSDLARVGGPGRYNPNIGFPDPGAPLPGSGRITPQ